MIRLALATAVLLALPAAARTGYLHDLSPNNECGCLRCGGPYGLFCANPDLDGSPDHVTHALRKRR